MKLIITCMAIAMTAMLSACSTENKEEHALSTTDIELNAPPQKLEDAVAEAPAGEVADTTIFNDGRQAQTPDWDKKIIKTAHVKLELKEYALFDKYLHNNLRSYGAYISQEQQTQSSFKIENSVSIKVPVHRFDDMMNTLEREGVTILEKQVNTLDVTTEMYDTKSRIQAKQKARDKYFDYLKQAKNIKEAMEVQEKINELQEEIEAGSGRNKFLASQAAYSTVNIAYFQYLGDVVQDNPDPTFFTEIKEAFASGGSIITGLLLLLVTFWPISLSIIFLLIMKRAYWKRILKKIA